MYVAVVETQIDDFKAVKTQVFFDAAVETVKIGDGKDDGGFHDGDEINGLEAR